MTDASDHQLLERFVTCRDEAAFAILAGRHAALVTGVCRRVLHDKDEVDDVLQETLLVLARKAADVPWQPSVGPWLSAVAYRLAQSARAARRRRREQPCEMLENGHEDREEPPARDADPLAGAASRELCGIVREEVARLPTKYRDPLTLCYLEGKTCAQAAHDLGWPVGSMSRRLEKARQLLRERLTGVALLATLFVVVILSFWLGRMRYPGANLALSPADAPGCFIQADLPDRVELMRQLAELPSSEIDSRLVATLAEQAAHSADRIEAHDPGRLRELWRELARDMGTLAEAAKLGDRPATQVAAARLYAVCVQCHQ